MSDHKHTPPGYRVDVSYHSGATYTYYAYRVTYTAKGLTVVHTGGKERARPQDFRRFAVEPLEGSAE